MARICIYGVGAIGEAFGPRREVPNVNTAAREGDAFVSADGCELFFSSDVADSYDPYRAVVRP